MANRSIVLTNLDALGQIVGALNGLEEGYKGAGYIDALIKQAHHVAAEGFDRQAALTAKTGVLSHVYEFGVAGITRGTPKIEDATSPAARLWVHTLRGRGGVWNINYRFRTAKVPNPKPTTRDTGVPSKYLRKISRRNYLFYNKAYVMETGMTVDIKPKNGRYIFVPFYKKPNNPLDRRGFMMWDYARLGKSIRAKPGRTTRGTFGAFWNAWWESNGAKTIETNMSEKIETDYAVIMNQATAKANATRTKSALQVARALSDARAEGAASTLRVLTRRARGTVTTI